MSEETKQHKYKLGPASVAAIREDMREIAELRGLLQLKMQANKRMTDTLLQEIHGVDSKTLSTHLFDLLDEEENGQPVTFIVLMPRGPQQNGR